MEIKIALAGNPNCGKTTLFNVLTGSNQYVGNWPGVTVEKKEGKLKKHKDVTITDLPGIYSLSPYTLEEVVARNYLIDERPDAILNIVDGTNLERNLYLTTQLTELGIPVVVAVNMIDVVKRNGDKIRLDALSAALGCKVVEISALKGTGITEAANAAVEAAKSGNMEPAHSFSGTVEHVLAHIEEVTVHNLPEEQQRWYAVKLFERDEKVHERLKLDKSVIDHIEKDIARVEKKLDDDSESIITNERYVYVASIIKTCLKKQNAGRLTTSDKIDKVVTNRYLSIPIILLVMFVIYYVSVTTVGSIFTDWANDGVFGDGWHLFGIGAGQYEEVSEEFADAQTIIDGFIEYEAEKGVDVDGLSESLDTESEDFEPETAKRELATFVGAIDKSDKATFLVEDEETLATEEHTATYKKLKKAVNIYTETYDCVAPDPSNYGIWIPGVPVFVEKGLDAVNCADWLKALILDGIIAGVGAVLGFVPQILVLFFLLSFLESCGYMARIAFIMDRIFRKFGLSGKSFIPILIGTGCGVPGIMASRTIENERDRRMTIMTTTFIPCSAKLPFIAMMAGAIFGGAPWVAPSAYFMGIMAIVCSGIMLKKTRIFSGDPAPFVMELPAYHMPALGNVLRAMWERGWSFIKKAGTIILLFTILVWFLTFFGFVDGTFTMLGEDEIGHSILATIGNCIAWIFTPLGWGEWQTAVASITGLIAKENIVGTMGVLYSAGDGTVYQNISTVFNVASGYSFLAFNLLCAPCVAAISAIAREMNSPKWTFFAVGYQCGFAYAVALVINQLGSIFIGQPNIFGIIVSVLLLAVAAFMLFKPSKESERLVKRARANK
ncbi:MAG: ferrous iron transport protein B [Ruminococcus sp.]|nr:ferrous iron transport protein B [Ruminococcus sp.]